MSRSNDVAATCVRALFIAAACVPCAPRTSTAQSAAELLEESLERYQAQTEGVLAYTLVQEVMGVATETRFERREVDGVRMFVPVGVPGVEPESDSPLGVFRAMAPIATLGKTEALPDGSCRAIEVSDLSSIDVGFADLPGEDTDFEPRSATFCLDGDTYMLRRMVVEGLATVGGERRPVTMRVASDDYREVDGLLVPYRTTVEVEGLQGAMPEGDAAEMREALEKARAQLDSMPAEQRAMVEKMLEQQFGQLDAYASGQPPALVVTVTEVRVEKG